MVFFKKVYSPKPVKLQERYIEGKRHYVTPNGKELPSVTTVLSLLSKAGIKAWKNRVGEVEANRVSKDSLKVGNELHKICEKFLDNMSIESYKNPVALKLFDQMKDELLKIQNIRIQEAPLYSEKLGVAGRVDCIADYDGKLSVIDFKSSTKKKVKSWVKSYFLQATAYALMYEELGGAKIDQIVILISARDGVVKAFVEDKAQYIEILKNVIEDYQLRKEFESEKEVLQ